MFGENIVISDPLLYRRPLFLRQLKNNQNQTNTTGVQNLKEFNNTAGWLSVFFVVFFVMNQSSRVTLKPTLPLPSHFENKKDNCSHLVTWTSTLSIIRIQSFVLLVASYFLSHKQRN